LGIPGSELALILVTQDQTRWCSPSRSRTVFCVRPRLVEGLLVLRAARSGLRVGSGCRSSFRGTEVGSRFQGV